jgi:hypothetical protein
LGDVSTGQIAFLGSGETARSGGAIFEALARSLSEPPRIAILETPAGFELNSAQVAGRVAEFMRTRLRNFEPVIELVPARKRGTPFSPDDAEILQPLLRANFIFMGPGSPTYAIRQLEGSLAWDLVRARHRMGAVLAFSSSAAIAVGCWALPVYEIFKAGAEVYSLAGLNLFRDYGVTLSFIPHWNNAEGGDEMDTSRCFIGLDRFDIWSNRLPPGNTTVGLDEHTGLILDFETGACAVSGVGSVSLLRSGDPRIFQAGSQFDLTELGPLHFPDPPESGIPLRAWELALAICPTKVAQPSADVRSLAELRRRARAARDWADSDRLRDRLASLGWNVQDTPDGQELMPR